MKLFMVNVDGECNACPINDNVKTTCEFAVYSFPHYKRLCKELGAKIVDKEVCDED